MQMFLDGHQEGQASRGNFSFSLDVFNGLFQDVSLQQMLRY